MTPAMLATIKTVFFHAVKDNTDNECRLCRQSLDFDASQFSPDDFVAPEPWRAGGLEAVPWAKVADAWCRAEGHHPDCPLKALADLVLATEACLAEQEPLQPAAPQLDARTMARVAMHFRGWAYAEHSVYLEGYDDLDELIANYERAMGGTPPDLGLYFYIDEYKAGSNAAPLPAEAR